MRRSELTKRTGETYQLDQNDALDYIKSLCRSGHHTFCTYQYLLLQ